MSLAPRYPLIARSRPYSALGTDFYSHTMGWGFKLLDTLDFITRNGVSAREIWDTRIVQSLFFRRNFSDAGYCVNLGLRAALDGLLNIHLTREEADWLAQHPAFRDGPHAAQFQALIRDSTDRFLFNGDVWAIDEGELVFAHEPLLLVVGNPFEVTLWEAGLLNAYNTGIAYGTTARLICDQARHPRTGERLPVADFALRRMLCGIGGAAQISDYLLAGGMNSTSHTEVGFLHRDDPTPIRVVGTQAHLWIMIFGSDEDGFEAYAKAYPHAAAFLGDTTEFLHSGIPAAIAEIRRLREQGYNQFILVRDDSGDLAYHVNRAAAVFQEAGIENAGFIVSNNLDAQTIASLMRQTDQIAAFGVGTNAVTIQNSPGCVYKTVATILPEGTLNAVIKLSAEPDKTTIPGPQQVYRLYNGDGIMLADIITEMGEALPPAGMVRMYGPFFRQHRTRVAYTSCRRMLHKYVDRGQLIRPLPSLMEVRETSWELFERELHWGHRRLENPHRYRVGMSRRLHERRERMIGNALGEDGDIMEEI